MDDINYKELLDKYNVLKEEFESYQSSSEEAFRIINEKNIDLEEKLGAATSILEISKYINSNISNEDLVPMINDMIIGVLGVSYSTIYIKEKEKLIVKATNIIDENYNFYYEEYLSGFNKGEIYILNSKDELCHKDDKCKSIKIHCILGVPIQIGSNSIGYILVEHSLYGFFSSEHISYISSVANQIGIALENNFLYKKVVDSAIRDPLMGIFNRRHFFDLVENNICKYPNRQFGIVMADIDDFKKVNDVYGHQFGDEVLIEICKLISTNIGSRDFLARYGGEELIIYIGDVSDRNKVFQKIDRIRALISEHVIEYENLSSKVTVSFGISYYIDENSSLKNVLKSADDMLYYSKKNNKNRVTSTDIFNDLGLIL